MYLAVYQTISSHTVAVLLGIDLNINSVLDITSPKLNVNFHINLILHLHSTYKRTCLYMKQYLKSNMDGLTLIEVIVAISLLTIFLLAFVRFYSTPLQLNTFNDKDLQATNIAREQVAIFESKTITSLCGYTIDPQNAQYYLKTEFIKEFTLETRITISPESGDYFHKELHQVYIQVKNEKGRVLTETYTYYEGEGDISCP